ncbi:MAG: protease modulator HflK [Pseudomonadota bacterium]
MNMLDGFKTRFGGFAMAGKKNPWGGGSDSSESGGGDDAPKGDKNDGPRNPWLPGGGSGNGRRPSNIEDIFKSRGPEGPRRGGGPGGPNLRLPELPGGRSWAPILIVGALILWEVATGVHIVEPRENGIVKTLGSYTETLPSGFHIRLPYPIQTVDIEDVEGVRAVNIPGGASEKLILTGDQNLVDLSYIVRWRIKDLPDFKFQLAEPEETVNEVAEAAMRASVAEKTLDDTFTGQGRAEIQQSVRERMQEALDNYRAGIQVVGVEIAKADPPSAVVEAFRDVSVAEQNADRDRNQAQGYAQQTIAQAEGEAEAFDKVYEQYRLAPVVTRQRLYYETMERVLAQTDKTVVEAGGVTTYLPLPEVRRRSTPPQPAPSAQTGGQ